MARKPRIHSSGALYHVMLRGNDRQEIFFSDVDLSRFMLFMQEASERYNCRFIAFCLMNNHIHLAVQVGAVPLSRIMQNISFRYTRWINWSRLHCDKSTCFLCNTQAHLYHKQDREGACES